MANLLKLAKVHAIIGLLEQNWWYRRIARESGDGFPKCQVVVENGAGKNRRG